MKKIIATIIVLSVSFISVSLFAQVVDKEYILKRINSMRKIGCMCGDTYYPPVPALVWNDTLELVSQEHSNYMFKEKAYGHFGKDGSSAGMRLKEKGYNYFACADNVAYGQESDEEVMLAWRQSPVHCKNMMNKHLTQVAVARNDYYWTMTLACPAKKKTIE